MTTPELQAMPIEQAHLQLKPMQEIDPKLISQQGTLLSAIKLCISMAGFDSDKEVFLPLGIDAGHWSRICKGDAHFPIDKLCSLMDLCGNEAPLLWLTDARGYEMASLRHKETEMQTKLRVANETITRMKTERAAEIRLLSEMMSQRTNA